MPLFGELFVSEMLNKSVLDPKGDELGRLKDLIVIKGKPLPRVSALILEEKKRLYLLEWDKVGIFNKRIMSSKVYSGELVPYESSDQNLLIARDIFDKQIVDANGAKIVRVNDVKLEGERDNACLTGVDVGIRGILRRLGIEGKSEKAYSFFGKNVAHNIIHWSYIQPLEPRLSTISLLVPRQMLSELHPADLADIISEVPLKQGTALFKNLDLNVAADTIHELQPNIQMSIIESLDKELAADIIERMPPDKAADLLAELGTEHAREILESIEKEEAEDIQELLAHEEDTAGGLMTNEFIAYGPALTIGEAIERFKIEAPDVEKVYYIYIVDEKKLVGVISLKDMLLHQPHITLSEIMEPKLKSVTPDTKQKAVAEIISKYNLVAIPVASDEGELLGVVTVDDVIDIFLPPASRKKRRGI
ncbi:MAG: CBS domain-containing protein [Nitrospirota bacterium]|nr:CBS domain-containing protein [Nitrospirota bacterium]